MSRRRSARAAEVLWCAAVIAVAVFTRQAPAQVFTVPAPGEEPAEKHDGFSVRKEDAKFNDALEDFARYRDKKAWELAFRSLETLAEGKREGMVATGDGFFVPSRQRVMLGLTSLPPEGKQAFRLFYDARAKQLLDKVENAAKGQAPAGGGSAPGAAAVDEVAALREIYDRYFITSVGDRAADRLGDALFESGDFAAAAAAWGSILRDFPDTALPRVRLHVKRAVALARGAQWEAFEESLRAVRTEFAGERVTVGGREVVATEFLESLRAVASGTGAGGVPGGPVAADGPVELPREDKPAWQIQLFDASLRAKLEGALTNNGWGRHMTGLSTLVPPAATDGQRVYVNWLGVVFAADARTGKLLWRNRGFDKLGDKFQHFVNQMLDVECYTLTLAGDALFVTGINLERVQNYQEPVKLVCMTPADGKVKWSSNTGSLSGFNFLGSPVKVGEVVYATARKQQGQDVVLLAIGFAKGELLWQLDLGAAQAGQTYRGEPDMPQPLIVPHAGGSLYVLTNNGALLAVDTGARRLSWAFTYAPPPVSGRQRFWGGYQAAPEPKMGAAAFARGSTLYLKEEDGDAAYAVDLSGPSLLWRRPLDRENSVRLVGGRLLSIGQDLGAIDATTRAMAWSASLPPLGARLNPLVSETRLLAFAPRGIYEIDVADGDTVRIFRGADRESVGGDLCRAPGRLIAVSNLAITAYPVADAPAQATAE
jgi:outer membrane protein assembly factor BamB